MALHRSLGSQGIPGPLVGDPSKMKVHLSGGFIHYETEVQESVMKKCGLSKLQNISI